MLLDIPIQPTQYVAFLALVPIALVICLGFFLGTAMVQRNLSHGAMGRYMWGILLLAILTVLPLKAASDQVSAWQAKTHVSYVRLKGDTQLLFYKNGRIDQVVEVGGKYQVLNRWDLVKGQDNGRLSPAPR